MKTILAPADFSPASINAVNYAADMACTIGCDLLLLHVYPLPAVAGDVPVPIYGTDNSEEYQQEKLDKLRDDLLFRTRERIKIKTLAVQGDILSKIEETCSLINPYAVVAGPETVGSIGELVGAAVTSELMKDLQWPVIIIPEGVHFSNIKKIGLACDFKKVIHTIPVKEIRTMVKEFNAELHVLHVNDEPEYPYNADTIEESGWLQEMLFDIQPKYHLINNYNIEEGIEQFAATNKLDMLIVIPKKHSVLHNIFLKSHSKQLVLHAHVPVMAVHE
jgi:nucleotide-binding universal stress UspA family protein